MSTEAMRLALDALIANDTWHVDYDDHGEIGLSPELVAFLATTPRTRSTCSRTRPAARSWCIRSRTC